MIQRPPPEQMAQTGALAEETERRVRAALAEFGRLNPGAVAVVTSWWRSSAHNAAVGGAPWSQHRLGTAMDVAPLDTHFLECLAGALRRAGLISVPYGQHVHAQLLQAGQAHRSLFVT